MFYKGLQVCAQGVMLETTREDVKTSKYVYKGLPECAQCVVLEITREDVKNAQHIMLPAVIVIELVTLQEFVTAVRSTSTRSYNA